MLLKLYVPVAERVRALTSKAQRDRGEGPVPFVILVAVIAVGAVAIGTLIINISTGWLNTHVPKP
ncbi:hypothetical protein [Hamadaea tsunoensis]|uniref:hypothetical protein n=1 Tax=Hamadaea tsunoensis TaxID=53368 RepID=UPI0003F6A99A|nr:hypothetical protein [Hamadaea tsunoensis]